MKTILWFIACCLCSAPAFSQVQFFPTDSWEEAKKEAKKQNKLIFVDIYTDWCGSCKWMDSNVFPNKELGAFFNEHFVSIKANATEGKAWEAFAKENRATGFPFLMVFDSKGKALYWDWEAPEAKALMAWAKKAMDPKQQYPDLMEKYRAMSKKYPKKVNDVNFRREFLWATHKLGLQPFNEFALRQASLDSIFALLPQKEWAQPENWHFVKQYKHFHDSKVLLYTINNPKLFFQYNDSAEVAQTLESMWDVRYGLARAAVDFADPALYKARYDSIYSEMIAAGYEYLRVLSDFQEGMFKQDWDLLEKYAIQSLKYPYYPQMSATQNGFALKLVENRHNNPESLATARKLSELSIAAERQSYSLHTYARILYCMGDVEEAIKIGEEALSISLFEDEKKQIEADLKKMKEGGKLFE